MAKDQTLSSKDAALFRQVVRNFENKMYKKGLKAADQILRKNPNHADTQAMKALIISNQGQLKEAFALAKIALQNNMKSHVCWHVYGLLYRQDKNYDESIKAYKFALRLDPESVVIQRDLAHLQIQMRDYTGYVASRKNMLQQKPGVRQNWTALAISHHLAGSFEEAENVLTTYEDTLKQTPPKTDMEHWEAILYKNRIIAESGEYEKAYEHLEAVGKKSPDILGVMELRAEYLLKLERKSEAEEAYAALIDRNPDCSAYYDGWTQAKGFGNGDDEAMKKAFDALSEKHPRSDLPRRRPLDFLEGATFRSAADSYLQRMLRKGIPSTFANIKHLYTNASKMRVIEELVLDYEKNIPTTNGSTDKHVNGDSSPDQFQSSVIYFLAQHYNYRLSRDLSKALSYIEKAIKLDPKSVDYHQTKARTLKYQGATAEAAKVMDYARSLDERDRAINTKCAKYQLRNDQNEKALETASKFTRNETPTGPLGDLIDMQCVWYLTEDALSYLRQKKIGLALKRFETCWKVFEIWGEDQFDFHNFSLRKGMIRAYIDMLRWEDRLRENPFWSRMALGAIEAYIMLHDNPDLLHGPSFAHGVNGNATNGEIDEGERKRQIKKAKKEQERSRKEEEKKAEALRQAAQKANKTGSSNEDKKPEDPDPLGQALAETRTPLEDAMKYLTPILELSPENIDGQLAGFEVFFRRKKFLLALRCLLAVHASIPQHPQLHYDIYRLRTVLASTTALASLPPQVASLLKSQTTNLFDSETSISEWNTAFLNTHDGSPKHVLAGLKVRDLLNTGDKAVRRECEAGVARVPSLDACELDDARAGLRVLSEVWGSSAEARGRYMREARKRFAEADAFR